MPAYATSTSVTITSGNYSDAGSGIASNVLTRSNGQSPIGGVCPAVGTFTGSTVVSSPDTGVVNGQCYVYTLTGTDNVGNTASLATTNAVLVDTRAPTDAFTLTAATGAFKSGTTIYYKGNAAGSFKLRDTVTDGVSGPASATFGLLSGGAGFAAHGSETISGSGPYDSTAITLGGSRLRQPDRAGPLDRRGGEHVERHDASLSRSTTRHRPAARSASPPTRRAPRSRSPPATTATAAPASPAARTRSPARTASRRPQASAPAPATAARQPSRAPTPASSTASATSTPSPPPTTSATRAPSSTSPVLVDTTTPADAFTLTAVSGGVHKSGATIYYKGNAAGSFKLRNAVTDAGSGPASTTFGLLGGCTGASHCSETVGGSSPYDSTAISWASASGTGSLAAHGTDAAGNSASDTTFTLTLDNTAPSGGSISVPAYATSTSVTITSGNYSRRRLRPHRRLEHDHPLERARRPSPASAPAPATAAATTVSSPDTGVVGRPVLRLHPHRHRQRRQHEHRSTSPVLVDATAPAYTSSALDAAGTHVDLAFTETASGLDSGSTTPTSAFTVTGATVSGVSYTDATHIRLTLASRLYGDAAPTVAYNPGALTERARR